MKQKVIISILIIVLLSVGLIAGLFLVKKNQDIREKAAPASNLSIIPTTQTKNPSEALNLKVIVDTGSNRVTGFDLVLNYNKDAIEITSIVVGNETSAFTNVIKNQIDNKSGKIVYSAFTLESQSAIFGSNVELLSISGKVLDSTTQGTYTFSFDSKTAVSGSNEGQNVLVNSSEGSIVVKSTNNEKSAVASGTASPIPTSTLKISQTTATPTSKPQSSNNPQLPVTGSGEVSLYFGGFAIFLILVSVALI